MTSGTVKVTFLSDWQCGTGQGRHGGVDRTTARDDHGLPYVPAKTLAGVWRDACESVARGFDNGVIGGPWSQLVERLFGRAAGSGSRPDPTTDGGLLTVRPAQLPRQWIAALAPLELSSTAAHRESDTERRLLRDGLVVTRFGVAVDDETGVASDDTLREFELARAGLMLEAPWSLPGNPTWPVSLLLQGGARMVTHVGARRRRGAGRCTVSVSGFADSLEELLASHRGELGAVTVESALPPAPRPDVTATASAPIADQPPEPDAPPEPTGQVTGPPAYLRRRATVIVTAKLPIVVSRSVLGNTVRSLDFVPGSILLPIVARALGDSATAWIRDARLVVTDATPVIDGRRACRTPMGIVSEDKGQAWTWTSRGHNALVAAAPSGAKPVGQWCVTDDPEGVEADGGLKVAALPLVSRAHAVIDDESQRPGEDGLYVYEAIPAGTKLAFEIWDDGVLDGSGSRAIRALQGATVSLGRAKRGDYGAATLAIDGESAANRTASAPGSALGVFQVRLSSDAVLIDDGGVITPRADVAVAQLQARLGSGYAVELLDARVGVVRRESWAGAIGLPRDSVTALAAGSLLKVSCQPPAPRGDLARALSRGIGERRVEGYGRVDLFEHEGGDEVRLTKGQVERVGTAGRSDTVVPVGDIWSDIRRAIWSEELLSRIRRAANDSAVRGSVVPPGATAAQLGSLRTAAHLLPRDAGAVDRWATSTEAVPERSAAWGHRLTTIRSVAVRPPSTDWATQLITTIAVLGPAGGALVPTDLGGVPPEQVASWFLVECLRVAAVEKQRQSETPQEVTR